jgi:hypothetical protein
MDNLTSSPDVAAEKPANEERKAYGTAKTENLRDSGLWRLLLPGFVIVCCLVLLAIPLIILIELLITSLTSPTLSHVSLTWLWIVLIIVELIIIAVIIRGLIKIFMTQAGNYRSY